MNQNTIDELPDVLCASSGERISSAADWNRHRQYLLELIEVEYGRLPPAPPRTSGELLNAHPLPPPFSGRHEQYHIVTGPRGTFTFLLDLLIPDGAGKHPAILTGDACWGFVQPDIAAEVMRRGYILAQFNRTEVVPDVDEPARASTLYREYPDGDFGALAAWAWGYHRCVDFLVTMPDVDATRIAVTGHSRGGKAALLAGATDERIALTAPNNSGCGGAGCYRFQGPTSETMADIVSRFPYWFHAGLKEYVGRETALPFDQHTVKALVAPRALLSTEALGDLWANPSGTWLTHLAASEVYRFLGAQDRIGIWYREGGHQQGLQDWAVLLGFADSQFYGKPAAHRFGVNPFKDLPASFSWTAPAR
jgi:hypothetical protein